MYLIVCVLYLVKYLDVVSHVCTCCTVCVCCTYLAVCVCCTYLADFMCVIVSFCIEDLYVNLQCCRYSYPV